MLKRWIDKFRAQRLDKQLNCFLSYSIVLVTIVVFIVSTASYSVSANQHSKEMMKTHLSAMASMYENAFNGYNDMIHAIVIDPSIQEFMRSYWEKGTTNYTLSVAARNTIYNFSNINSSIQSIVILYGDPVKYLSRKISLVSMDRYIQYYKIDYAESMKANNGVLRVNMNARYATNGDNYLTFYFPVYSSTTVNIEMGLLCFTVKDEDMEKIYVQREKSNSENSIFVNSDGRIVATSDKKEGNRFAYVNELKGQEGSFNEGNRLYVYQKIGEWNFYLVQSQSRAEYMLNGAKIIILLSIIVIIVLIILLILSRRLVQILYMPLQSIVEKMKNVSDGQLNVRMRKDHTCEDFKTMATGFNSMMDEIDFLLEQVKQEQKQIEEIRFAALQSQIKPHFLYNTLDCIHWQAVADGNVQISTLVKALATYYRICLSDGRDIISLRQEVEHVRNYLIIQNMRYGDIIESEIELPENLFDQQIPKITLQPLVENSIYHGIRVKEGKRGKVSIVCVQSDDEVRIKISDSGTGMTKEEIAHINASISETEKNYGYGVRNVHRRIEILYGKAYGLWFYEKTGGVNVRITLPIRKCEDQESERFMRSSDLMN